MTPADAVLRALAIVSARVAAGQLTDEDALALLETLRPHAGSQSPPEASALPLETSAGTQLALASQGALARPMTPAVRVRRARTTRDALARVWRHWQEATGHHRSKLTPERKRAVLARLAQGYTEADIHLAIDGCAGSDFHAGKHDDLTLICRNGSKLEKFRDMASGSEDWGDYEYTEKNSEADSLRARIAEAMKDGDHGRYERLNTKLRELLS